MYKKFEAVCQEVDEFMANDRVKFVENQIQTVGESVKKFYNGVMQDLILPPLAIKESTIHNNNLPPTCETNESPIDANPNFEVEGDGDGDLMNEKSCQEVEKLYHEKPESDDSVFEDANWGIENIIDSDLGIEKKIEEEEEEEEPFDGFDCDSNASSKMESLITCNEENKEEKSKSYDSSMGDFYSASSYDLSSSESSITFASSEFALLNDSMVDFEDIDMETIDLTEKEELVESGVIVEGEKVFYFPYGSKGSHSYKKILQDAFMSRKKLTKEYKQLAIWCENMDKEVIKKIGKNNATKSQAQDFPDSEWEIL